MSFNFDDLVAGAKDVCDKAAAKVGEAIDYSKTQLDRSQLRSRIKDTYCKLGQLYYDMQEQGDDKTDEMKNIIAEIKELRGKLDEADSAVNSKKPKVCKFCETANDASSVYCTKCGEKL
ncbi:MAG: hypothetical protein K2H23_09065 [Oscillospiraceae bacterium]|nr:hypothetical protein [Oscillospiraceae bacterium]